MKFENKILTWRTPFMTRLLGMLLVCIVLQGTIFAEEKCCKGPFGPKGQTGPAGAPGPDFGQFACLYNNAGQVLTIGQNVLFQNEISLAGITYDNSTGILTLQPGTYSVTYFSNPSGGLNLVANGAVVPNSPLAGVATLLTFSNGTNTLALQAQSNVNLTAPGTNQCCAMITVYQIN